MDPARPSRTAEYMALFRALETAQPAGRRICEDPLARRFLGRRLKLAASAARVPLTGGLVARYIDHRWPGPRLSGVVRTRVIDELVSAALREGCESLVILGAGYDTRGSRLSEARARPVWEVDHPATQERKRRALGAEAGRVTHVAVDFERDDLGDSLAGAGFAAGTRTCVLWEGVFSYLSVEAIDATLGWVTSACGPGSRLVLTYVTESALAEDDAAWIDAVVSVGEPFQTGLDPGDAPAFFAARGLELVYDRSTREDAERFVPARKAEGIPGFYRVAELRPAAPPS